jgi:iron complex transport system substrate-binding protein
VIWSCIALFAAACGDGGSAPAASVAGEQGSGSTGAAASPFPVTIATVAGDVTLAERPTRIVSLSPTATEMLFAIGAGDQVVAVDDRSNHPAEAPMTDLSGYEPNVEAIASFEPDLVVYSNDPGDLGGSLEDLGIPALLQPAAATLEDTYDQIAQLGLATGNAEEAAGVVDRMRVEIEAIVASVDPPPTPPTYYHELDDTFYSVTSQTFIGQLYGLLGLENIADATGEDAGGYPQLSAEYIVEADPDLIFLADTKCCGQSPQTVAGRPGWAGISAVRAGRVIALDDDVASRWGPRVVDLLRTIATAISTIEEAAA